MSILVFCPQTVRRLIFAAVLAGVICASAAESKKTEISIRPIDSKEAAKVSYARQIKPLLSADCDECHSADDHKAGFDISTITSLKKGGKKAGPGVVPGKPDESSIVKYIRGLADGPQMPKGETALSENELHLIRSWIAAGAVDDSASAPALADADSVKTNVFSSLSASTAQHWEDVLVFSQDKNEQFAARRALRLGLVAPAAPPPNIAGPAYNEIDKFVLAHWSDAKLPQAKNPPPVCDDTTFVRRVYLDIIGVIPTATESQQFAADTDPHKRAKLVDTLLAQDKDYAAHWTPFWEDALASQPTMGGVGEHGDYSDFIFNSFAENKPYDQFVAEILDPTMPGHKESNLANANGKTNIIGFVRNQTHTDTIQTAANTAQIFLGTGMKCASCHNHFLNKEWPQARFTAFAGLFATNNLELIRCEKHSGHFVEAAFPFELPDAPRKVPKSLNQRLHYMTTLLIDPADPRFSKTIVNRLWKRYLGLGLFEPVDDYRLDRPASNPALLNWLADDFMRHNYDLKHTIRLILTSRTYQLQYDPSLEDHFDVQKPDQPRFARSPALRRLTAEQFVDSLHEAVAKQWDQKRLFRSTTSTEFTRAVGKPAARNEICTARADDVAVVQSLELLNGTELHDITYNGEILDELASHEDRKRIVNELYWTLLSRPPTSREMKLGVGYLKSNWGETG
ncbi:MAG TPA: PSD1 and planctomycete cytochrome C domain-containing protein, partial [Verrucomicrobiae bacterium]